MRLSVLSRRGSVHAGSPAAGSGGCSIILCAKTPAADSAFVPARAPPPHLQQEVADGLIAALAVHHLRVVLQGEHA